MYSIRRGIFETNSSSTHSLVIGEEYENYIPISSHIKIQWCDTDDSYCLTTFQEKLSYLVSHIAYHLVYNCNTYKDLLNDLEENTEYKILKNFIKKEYKKKIRFPLNKNDNLEDLIIINHQLVTWGSSILDEVLDDLLLTLHYAKEELDKMSLKSKLKIYFDSKTEVVFGRD